MAVYHGYLIILRWHVLQIFGHDSLLLKGLQLCRVLVPNNREPEKLNRVIEHVRHICRSVVPISSRGSNLTSAVHQATRDPTPSRGAEDPLTSRSHAKLTQVPQSVKHQPKTCSYVLTPLQYISSSPTPISSSPPPTTQNLQKATCLNFSTPAHSPQTTRLSKTRSHPRNPPPPLIGNPR